MHKFILISLLCLSTTIFATEESKNTEIQEKKVSPLQRMSMELSNPVSDLKIIPFEYIHYNDVGPSKKGTQDELTITALLPKHAVGDNYEVRPRFALPLQRTHNMNGTDENEYGLDDLEPSLLFSPRGQRDFIWAVGPIFHLPSSTNDNFGTGKFSAGPTFVLVKMDNDTGWTLGTVSSTLFPIAGDSSKPDDTTFFMQPFVSKALSTGTKLGIQSPATYNFSSDSWDSSAFAFLGQIFMVNKHFFNVQIGPQFYISSNESSGKQDEWSYRLQFTMIIPQFAKNS